MAAEVLSVGSLALNDTVYADGRTQMGAPGGNALYAAVGARIWSDEVSIAAVVGQDWPASFTESLAVSGVDLTHLVHSDEETLRAWTIYEPCGQRRYLSRNAEVIPLTPNPYRSHPLSPEEASAFTAAAHDVHLRNSPRPHALTSTGKAPAAVHLAPMQFETLGAWLELLADRDDIFVSLDVPPFSPTAPASDRTLAALLEHVDAFIPSEVEADSIRPGASPEAFCREMAALGPRIVVVKLGAAGAALYEAERDRFTHIAPCPVQVEDPTGAGDAFCGGFAHGMVQTGDPLRAAAYGTVSASIVIERSGGLHALGVERAAAHERLRALDGTSS